jgi:hypothetical protein
MPYGGNLTRCCVVAAAGRQWPGLVTPYDSDLGEQVDEDATSRISELLALQQRP